jgi:NAD-dependent dihydropyrimidine dehydrogenase PreA subunit
MKIIVNKNKCTGCGTCKETCPKGAKIWNVDENAKPSNLRFCHLCTICASKCPTNAIQIIRDDNYEKKERKIKSENI